VADSELQTSRAIRLGSRSSYRFCQSRIPHRDTELAYQIGVSYVYCLWVIVSSNHIPENVAEG